MPTQPQPWSLPNQGTYKLNVDGAVFAASGNIRVGAVIRNYKGEVMLAMTQKINCSPSPELAEAWAILRGISVAIEAGFSSIILEGDAKYILADLCSEEDLLTCYGHILEDALLLKSAFQSFTVSTVRRLANEVAHLLAKMSKFMDGSYVWMEDVPPQILSAITRDCNICFLE